LSCWLWRRAKLSELGVSIEQQQIYAVGAAAASYRQALNRLAKAQLNLSWTEVRSPVDGLVTNLFLAPGRLRRRRPARPFAGRRAFILGGRIFRGNDNRADRGRRSREYLADGLSAGDQRHVDSLSRAINVPNGQANATGIADVNPVFT
jgi:multidrug efflux pump subunit AcrA (membrane-fusion protein)